MTASIANATVRVVSAGPLVSFQDAGRFGRLRYGIPASGPMDRVAQATSNAVLDNPLTATVVEVSRGGTVVECHGDALTVAVVGSGFRVELNGVANGSNTVVTLTANDRLSIGSGDTGSWAYLAVAGDIDASRWLGQTATHCQSGFGGGVLAAGTDIAVHAARAMPAADGPITQFGRGIGRDEEIRVVLGPQEHRFAPEAVARFTSSPFRVTEAFDRMGVRLDGPVLELAGGLSIPSEPIVRGSVQVAGDGAPTVLLADHQTTGGYPKIATVVDADLDALCQRRPGDTVRFVAVTPAEAVEAARHHASAVQMFLNNDLLRDRRLARRLADTDLIGDVSERSAEN